MVCFPFLFLVKSSKSLFVLPTFLRILDHLLAHNNSLLNDGDCPTSDRVVIKFILNYITIIDMY